MTEQMSAGLNEHEAHSVLDSLNAIVWRGDPETYCFTYVSAAAERLLGYPVDNWIGDPQFWADHMHPEDRDWALNYCVDNTTALRDHDFEYRMIATDGRDVWLKDVVHLLVEDGKAKESVGLMLDITRQKEADEYRQHYERAQENQRRALELNDEIVQGLATAKYALDLNLAPKAEQALDETLMKARQIVGELLDRDGNKEGVPTDFLRRNGSPES